MAMAIFPFFYLLPFLTFIPSAHSKLNVNYYHKSCPLFPEIVAKAATDKQLSAPTTAAAMLRVFFHDCMVGGCDASVLISSNSFNTAERDSDINLSLPGDAFDLVTRAKTTLELQCPGVVSCADILAVATRNLITMVGGPYYKVLLGRKDGLTSSAAAVAGHIANSTAPLSEIISIFATHGLSVQEMVALSGAHTIGFAHCIEFSHRLFGSKSDPAYNPKYADGLKKLCENYTKDSTMAAFLDAMTPGKFDNMYYVNLKRGLGLLASDQAMVADGRTRPYVEAYAANQTEFFRAFAKAMEKVSVYKVKTGRQGEVRHRCDQFNTIKTKRD